MVVGQGTVIGWRGGGATNGFNGAMLVARTRDTSGVLIPGSYLSYSYVDFNHNSIGNQQSMGGQGIRYSSCWIQKSQPIAGYKILSFHEITSQ
jgi:hypothetical protein